MIEQELQYEGNGTVKLSQVALVETSSSGYAEA